MQNQSAREVLLVGNKEVDVLALKEVRDLPEKRQKSRVKEIKTGAQFLQQLPRFPKHRKCQDLPWAILFLLTVIALAVYVAYFLMSVSVNADSSFQHSKTHDHLTPQDIKSDAMTANLSCIVGCVGGLLAAFLWVMMARACPGPVVYISLYLVPALFVVGGVVMMYFGMQGSHMDLGLVISGGVLILVGGLSFILYTCCWAKYIPFTIEVVEMVAEVSNEHPCMISISAIGGFLSAVWVVLCAIAWWSFAEKHNTDYKDQNKGVMGPVDFAFVLVLFWGSGVIHTVCHVAYAGVFSRWYFGEEEAPICKSLQAAVTTSFGSIAFGTFIVAAINAVQALIRSVRVALQEDGNIVGCILMMILECVVDCIGDLMEYFNEWAFVQCAIRGSSYCESARITCALCASNGIQAIIGDLLIDRVVSLGALFSGLVGMGLGAGLAMARKQVDHSHISSEEVLTIGIVGGLLGGLLAGGGVMTIFSSGTKAILTCWAEDPDRLHEEHELDDMHTEFNDKVRGYEMS
ncbi:Protein PNS1 [Durusdinium trenchii]|uniref:Choline transporter-like protein n=1 Tax=Durusdinium trenchii TaxID=1381693 RepID=A0ABP0JTT6_9DINO